MKTGAQALPQPPPDASPAIPFLFLGLFLARGLAYTSPYNPNPPSSPTMPKEVRAQSHPHRVQPVPLPTQESASSKGARAAAQWPPSDDERLMEARKSGLSWKPIAAKYFPYKTHNACRKRHERLMEQQNARDLDGVKLEVLAREYMNVRREMWSILAERVGEKWATVEAKCMERGLKNLQAAHRAGQRKERANHEGDGGRGNYYEGDSGIGYSDAENEVEDYSSSLEAGPSQGGADHQQPQPSPTAGFQPNQRGGPSIQSMLSPEPHPGHHAPPS